MGLYKPKRMITNHERRAVSLFAKYAMQISEVCFFFLAKYYPKEKEKEKEFKQG